MGIGVDVVDVTRFERAAERTPSMLPRLFTSAELHHRDGSPRTAASLAARFAAKEAVAKALGAPSGMEWHHCVVAADTAGRPSLEMSGTVLAEAQRLGADRWHLTLSHDGGVAIAMVVAESDALTGPTP